MSHFNSRRLLVLVLILMFAICAMPVQAQEYRYRYVSLNSADLELPPGYTDFFATSIHDSGRVYGGVCDASFVCYIAVYEDGAITVLNPEVPIFFFGTQVNAGGTVGDGVLVDQANFIGQAALFHGDKVELIPRQPGEFSSFVWKLTDSGMALVVSFDENFLDTVLLYKNGKVTPLVGMPYESFNFLDLDINNLGIISGRTNVEGLGARGFRFDTRTGETTLLDPIPPDQQTWALGINTRGDILGYSFDFGGIERIGVWNGKGEFQTYFVEGTPEFPTTSNGLLFNDNNLIVITLVTSPAAERFNSYLVPKPGVRLNLADLVENLPPGTRLTQIQDINNHGDMFGFSTDIGAFLLERIGP